MDLVFSEATVVLLLLSSLPNVWSESLYNKLKPDSYNFAAREDVHEHCHPWFIYRSSSHQCECYTNVHTKHYVKCTDHGALLKIGYCMTYCALLNETSVAHCIYFQVEGHNVTNSWDITLPDNISELNDYMCGPMNRKGRVCSECIDGFGVSFTSFGHQCSKCNEVWYGVPLLILVEIGPLTVFYVLILVFRFRITSAPMTSFVFYCHYIMYYITSNAPYVISIQNKGGFPSALLTIGTFVYGIWNLDNLRYLIAPFCVSSKLTGLNIDLIVYLFTLYPICLMFITWLFIRLHDGNYRPIVHLCKPFVFFCARLRRDWCIRNNIIDVFATFFLLSFTKLADESLMFVRCRAIVTVSNSTKSVAYADMSMSCYSKEHIPYIVVGYLTLFGLLAQTMLLILYPFKIFKAFLSKIGVCGQLEIIITTFVEKFHDCYRDGLDGGKDMRSFSGLYLILRMVLIITNDIGSTKVALFYIFLFLTLAAFLVAFFKPYKHFLDNLTDTLVLALLMVLVLCYVCMSSNIIMLSMVLCCSPIVVFVFVHVWKLFKCLRERCLLKNKCMEKYMSQSIILLFKFQDKPVDEQSTLLPQSGKISFGSCDSSQHC